MKANYFIFFILYSLLGNIITASAQIVIPLYEKDKVPNAKPALILADTFSFKSPQTKQDTQVIVPRTIMPTLTVFSPNATNATDIAIIVCSGGSYQGVADEVEGFPAAKKLSAAGITVFVLHYRVPRADMMTNKEIVPMQDAQTAIIYVREHAKQYHININHVGMIGFSAGGHLVSTAGTHYLNSYIPNPHHTDLRPSFLVLVYPVISFADSLTHLPSRMNLIGPDITPGKIKEYSNELHVTPQTPPAFIVHAIDDYGVPVQNSLLFYAAMLQNKVNTKLFLYAHGKHGFGIYNHTAVNQWIDEAIPWIKRVCN
jgi:acetyl esterase/lipase